ncbi:7532_t:CDS:2 [Gigaspora rosea]|nr:7532_t:CDS:2 [Gigaspora rosea]
MPDPIWVHFTQLGHVAGYKQKEKNEDNNDINILDMSTSVESEFTLVAFSSLPTSLVPSTLFNEKAFTRNTKPIKKLWKQARPAFKLPNQKKLSTTLLDSIYDETKKMLKL